MRSMLFSFPRRTEPNLRFADSLLVRTEYLVSCSGVHLMPDPESEAALIVSFSEGKPLLPTLPPIVIRLSFEDARSFGQELIRLANAEPHKEE